MVVFQNFAKSCSTGIQQIIGNKNKLHRSNHASTSNEILTECWRSD